MAFVLYWIFIFSSNLPPPPILPVSEGQRAAEQ